MGHEGVDVKRISPTADETATQTCNADTRHLTPDTERLCSYAPAGCQVVAVLVHRSQRCCLPTLNVHEHFVEMPRVAYPTAQAPERPSVDWTERVPLLILTAST